MDDYETKATYNLAETCCASISIEDLQSLSGGSVSTNSIVDVSRKLTYGAIRGSVGLRTNIAAQYPQASGTAVSPEQVLITPGAIAANYLVLYTLVENGDHVICQYPTYQQLYSVPKSFGAEVSLWKSKHLDNWSMDVNELVAMVKPNTKLIIIK